MKAVRVIAMGVAGLVVAAILSLSAFAIAGGSIGEPARPVSVPSSRETPSNSATSRTPTSSPEPSDDHGDASQEATSSTASLSEDSHGGGSASDSSSSDHDGDD